jgi:adenosylmethionine-8-amino-7-oxononanoate aminotransferase
MASTTSTELIQADRDHLIHPLHHPTLHAEPLVWVKGRGAVLVDIHGREFIDGMAGLWNVNAGHGREELAEAAAAQMRELAYASGYTGCTNVPAIRLAERLTQLSYPNLQAVFFACGGAEANESAFKTARWYWKAKGRADKVKIISRKLGYHGVTLAALSATGMSQFAKWFEPLAPGFVHTEAPYPYRLEGVRLGETVGQAAARMLEETILREGADTVAAFVAEPVQGAGGVIVPPDDYFPRVREICTRHDVLFIADEVITGFGRTGRWFALGRWNVLPDIVSFAKGVTSGYQPLGGIIVSRAIHEAIRTVPPENRWMHQYTYSGHPTCCAVGLKNLEIIEREGLPDRAAKLGQRLLDGLRSLYEFAAVGDVRGLGLMAAVELVEDRATKKTFEPDKKIGDRVGQAMQRRGVFTRNRNEVIMFAPPLVITEAQVDRIVSALREAIQEVLPAKA